MSTLYSIQCKCGHVGKIRLKENDTPYSSSWEHYSLIDLKGVSDYTVMVSKGWQDIFDHLKPVCPNCNTKLTPDAIIP